MNTLRIFKKSPVWLLGLMVLGTALLAALMFNRDYRRERAYLEEIYVQRGDNYIRAMEMLSNLDEGSGSWQAVVDRLWSHLEDGAEEVVYLGVSDEKGEPLAQGGLLALAHKELADTGPVYQGRGPGPVSWRLVKDGGKEIFLTYRKFFVPKRDKRKGPRHGEAGNMHDAERTARWAQLSALPPRHLWVGFDMARFNEAAQARTRTTAMFIGLLGLGGLCGLLALVLAYRWRLSKSLYEESQALASEIIGRLPLGLVIEDKDGRIREANQAALNIFDLDLADMRGRDLGALSHGLIPQEETVNGREIEISFEGGRSVRLSVYAGPINDSGGKMLGRVVLLENLGELGRLKAELAKGERLAALGRMAAGLAHELRNPLGALSGLAQHLLGKIPSEAETLKVMKISADRLNRSISDFLEYSKPLGLKLERMDLSEALKNLKILMSQEAASKGVKMEFDLPGPVWLKGDLSLLSQVFLNLILNSLAALERKEDGYVKVSLKTGKGRAFLTFRDNGPGFSAEQLAHPFMPYFTTRAEGTGLGLPLAEKTIMSHPGGSISLANHPEGGAMVSIGLPLD